MRPRGRGPISLICASDMKVFITQQTCAHCNKFLLCTVYLLWCKGCRLLPKRPFVFSCWKSPPFWWWKASLTTVNTSLLQHFSPTHFLGPRYTRGLVYGSGCLYHYNLLNSKLQFARQRNKWNDFISLTSVVNDLKNEQIWSVDHNRCEVWSARGDLEVTWTWRLRTEKWRGELNPIPYIFGVFFPIIMVI